MTLRGENSGAIDAIRAALKNDGEIHIYRCRFNDGAAGLEATRLLSGMTGSFVIVDYRKTQPTTWDQSLNAPEEAVEDLSLLASVQWSEPLPTTYFEDLNLDEVSPRGYLKKGSDPFETVNNNRKNQENNRSRNSGLRQERVRPLFQIASSEPTVQSQRQHQAVAGHRTDWLDPERPQLTTTQWQHAVSQLGLDWNQVIAGVLVGVAIGFCGYWAISSWGWL